MSAKHQLLDRKLFHWVRENRTGLTVHNAIYHLRIFDKDERRHITRRFAQMRSRNLLRLTSKSPVETFETCGVIPYDTKRPEWTQAKQGMLRNRSAPEAPRITSSIPALTSDEFLAAGGQIEILEPLKQTPHQGSRPTGAAFTFDD